MLEVTEAGAPAASREVPAVDALGALEVDAAEADALAVAAGGRATPSIAFVMFPSRCAKRVLANEVQKVDEVHSRAQRGQVLGIVVDVLIERSQCLGANGSREL